MKTARQSLVALVLSLILIGCNDSSLNVLVYDTSVKIPVPNGYCYISESNTGEAELFKEVQSMHAERSELIMMFVNCNELENFRTSKEGVLLNNFAYVMAPKRSITQRIYTPINEFIAEMEKVFLEQGVKIFKQATENMKSQNPDDSVLSDFKVNEMRILGSDENALYALAISEQQLVGVLPIKSVAITALTKINSKILTLQFETMFKDKEVIASMYKANKEWLKQAQRVN